MKAKKQTKESAVDLIQQCASAGADYWLRAEGQDENLVSALNRAKYRQLKERLEILNVPRPTPEEMYAIRH